MGMGMGMGMGRRNPRMMAVRIGLVALVILAGVVFHHSGRAYDTIRALYFVVIIGFLVYASRARRQRMQAGGQTPRAGGFGRMGGGWGASNGGMWGSGTQQNPPTTPLEGHLVEQPSDTEGGTPS